MKNMEANNGKCPDGFEYVSGYKGKFGYVNPFCRKIKKTVVKVKIKMEYPGKTKISGVVRKGIHFQKVSGDFNTDDIVKKNKKLSDALSKDKF